MKIEVLVSYSDLEIIEMRRFDIIRNIFLKFFNFDGWVEVVDIKYCWFISNILEVGFFEEI